MSDPSCMSAFRARGFICNFCSYSTARRFDPLAALSSAFEKVVHEDRIFNMLFFILFAIAAAQRLVRMRPETCAVGAMSVLNAVRAYPMESDRRPTVADSSV
ncbi:hypothetical protein KDW36_00335 [Burkholderia dolosa]|uniref:hypothetical protein n=1 Tax=Burkholderia dolosa TaxID=152500 RepID=UPI001BA021EE|nr:hypothetical protein [Burkholderia dolosa]MBR8311647.1 hypothetical protein [Burkholderia dolosa]